MTKFLICIELPNQVPAAIKTVDGEGVTEKIFLALTPHVEYELEKRGIPFRVPEEFYEEDELNNVGIQDIDVLHEICREIDDLIWCSNPVAKVLDLKPADLNQYYLKVLINSVSTRAFILSKVLQTLKPHRIFCFTTKTETVSRELFFVHESAWSKMIPQAAYAFNILVTSINEITDPSVLDRRVPGERYSNMQNQLKALVRRFLGIDRATTIRGRLLEGKSILTKIVHRDQSCSDRSKRSIIIFETGYSLGPLVKHIQKVGRYNLELWDIRNLFGNKSCDDPISRNNSISKMSLPSWLEVQRIRHLRDNFIRFGIDCWPAVENRLRRFVEIDIRNIVSNYFDLEDRLSDAPPLAIIASTMGDYNCSTAALAAKKYNVPFVVYQHGASGGHVMMNTWINQGERIGLQRSDYMLCFGDGDVDYLSRFKSAKAKIVPVGSAVLDELRTPISIDAKYNLYKQCGLDPRKKTVIYVPPAMYGNIRIAPYCHRAPSTGFEIERSLVSVFREFPNIQFIIKLHYANFHPSSPIAKLIHEERIKNCTVVTTPFSKLTALGDMFILDVPSTSLLEALTTDRPIILCGYRFPWAWSPNDWHPSILDMWQERVQYEENLREFLDLVRNNLSDGTFKSVNSEDKMLKLFGTYLDDGNSVERTYSFLESLPDMHDNCVV